MNREQASVEVVDCRGQAIAVQTVARAHQSPGELHRAFSVLLFDAVGRTVIQRRSADKIRFPLRWANACCGHPSPGSSVVSASLTRLREELGTGTADVELSEVGIHAYRAEDPASGQVEYEYDHVLTGVLTPEVELMPDPSEVAGLRWIAVVDLETDLRERPNDYVPWLGGVLSLWRARKTAEGAEAAEAAEGARE